MLAVHSIHLYLHGALPGRLKWRFRGSNLSRFDDNRLITKVVNCLKYLVEFLFAFKLHNGTVTHKIHINQRYERQGLDTSRNGPYAGATSHSVDAEERPVFDGVWRHTSCNSLLFQRADFIDY